MNFTFRKSFFIPLAFCLTTSFMQSTMAAISHGIDLEWKTLESKHFEVHFHNGEQALAEQTITIAEHWLIELQKSLQWQPDEPIEIIISDEREIVSGFLNPLLTHLRITLSPTPPEESIDFNQWLDLLIKHELTHALHLDKARKNRTFLKSAFGRHPLLYPNLFQPAWLIEGYATYQETDYNAGVGRGQSSLFHMFMRTEVKQGIKPLEQVNTNIASWPASNTRYLYGYYFYEFLEADYGKSSITRFINQYSTHLIPYRLDQSALLIFGKTFEELWLDFGLYLNDKFGKEINLINQSPIVSGSQVTSSGYQKLFGQPLENGNLLYAEDDAIHPPRVMLKKFKIEKTEFISEIQPEAHLDYHPKSGLLVSQIEIYRNTSALYDLFLIDLETGKNTRLTRGDRFRNATWNAEGDKILAVYSKLGQHSLVLLNEKGELVDLLWEGEEGEYIADIDWAPNNETLVASIKRNHDSWSLEEFNIEQRSWKILTQNKALEIQPQYSPDGQFIYYSADYEGVFNIQRLTLNNGNINTLTHVMGGAFSPRINTQGDLFYSGYTAQGYEVFHLKNNRPIKMVDTTALPKPNASMPIEYAAVDFEIDDYSVYSHLKPTWWTPTLSGDLDSTRLGAYTSGSDALKRHTYDAFINMDIQSTSLSGAINYSFDQWFPILQTHIETFGRKNYRVNTYQAEMLAPLLTRNNGLYLGLSLLYEKESNTIMLNDGNESEINSIDPLLGIGMIYDSRRYQLKSVSPSHGRLLSLTAETSSLFGGDASGQMFIAKWKEYISIKPQHVIAFRFTGGFGLNSPRPFQLGGSNISDSEYQNSPFLSSLPPRASLYNKRRYGLRGYPNNAKSLAGRRMIMYSLEWRFPLKRIEKSYQMLPVGLEQISSTLFAETASVWDAGTSPESYQHSVGAELNLHAEWSYLMPLKIRLGYAYGMREEGEHQLYFAFSSAF